MKKFTKLFLIMVLFIFIFPSSASADMGPKPSITINASNMPDGPCFMDLLIDYQLTMNSYINIKNPDKYDAKLFQVLKDYNVDGWRPALVTGTSTPLFGDIVCSIENGKSTSKFSYMGIPDRFRIIVVSSDGKTVVSNVIEREAFNSVVQFDYKTGKASENSPLMSYMLQFLITCSLTLVIEGLMLLLFRFSLKQNWKPFLIINILTQILLNLVIYFSMYKSGTLVALLLYIPLELLILIIEAVLFAIFLKQHSKLRRVMFALTANILSFFAGIAAISLFP